MRLTSSERQLGPIAPIIPDSHEERYSMLRNTKLLAVGLVGLGMLLGYAAASGHLNPALWARAGEPAPIFKADQSAAAPKRQAGCCDGVNQAQLVALAAPHELVATESLQSGKKPNILVIWGDDIGTWNISHNNRGMMGYRTPNIDRIAREGVSFTDYYGQQSCTAGRAAFIGGNVPVRTGMTKVGLPGAKEGWQKTDVTIA